MNKEKPPVVAYLAILGRFTLLPGIQQIKIGEFGIDCLIRYSFAEHIIDEKKNIKVPTEDCTIFSIEHKNYKREDLNKSQKVDEVLEKSLIAISELSLWSKSKEQVGKISSYIRQVGRSDVKYFFVEISDDSLIEWKNGSYWQSLKGFQILSGFLSNMVVTNGPSQNPTPSATRRILSCLDLINLGFYSDAFITAFALLDDLTQEVLKAGFEKKKLSLKEQKNILRGITEDRLANFLTSILKLCDWVSLEKENEKLFKKLKKINTKRNDIMHGSVRLTRNTAIEYIDIILEILSFLRQNPFDYTIEEFPTLKLIEPEYLKLSNLEKGESPANMTDYT